MKKRFWNWQTHRIRDDTAGEERTERVLELNGVIAEDSWWGDEVTPKEFKDELNAEKGDITVYINSPGGDCFAAAEIYNALLEYKGHVTVKIDGIAASAASVIAMAVDTVLMSPVSMLMAHNPSTIAFGDHTEMEKVIAMLGEVKESIINAYERKTGLPRKELSKLMEAETWMNANKAVELGFADDIMERTKPNEGNSMDMEMMFSQRTYDRILFNKIGECLSEKKSLTEELINKKVTEDWPDQDEKSDQEPGKKGSEDIPDMEEKPDPKEETKEEDNSDERQDETFKDQVSDGRSVEVLQNRLDVIKLFIS